MSNITSYSALNIAYIYICFIYESNRTNIHNVFLNNILSIDLIYFSMLNIFLNLLDFVNLVRIKIFNLPNRKLLHNN